MSYYCQPRGLKRKHPEDAEDEDPPRPIRRPPRYIQERQELLDITYDKLKKTEAEKNPSFLKQVLMTNIVRSLQKDMVRDGIQVNGLTRESTAPVWTAENNQVSNLDPPPSSNDLNFVGFPLDENGVDRPPTPIPDYTGTIYASEQYRCLMDIDDAPRATPFVRTVESAALWTDDNDRLSSLNWSSVLKSTDLDISNCGSDCTMSDDITSSTSLHTLMPAVTGIETYLSSSGVYSASSSPNANSNSLSGNTSPGSGSGSPPSSSEDEIFGDVDLTLYDYDYTPLSPPNVAMAPLTAEELMWSLSNDQKTSNSDDRDFLASIRT